MYVFLIHVIGPLWRTAFGWKGQSNPWVVNKKKEKKKKKLIVHDLSFWVNFKVVLAKGIQKEI